ncbi:MAG: PAS domain-containing protein [Deltaproteobacteria bacterium]|nr:PAS domain-containing protein [Deltaproteobacteria bacterium]
MVASVPSPSNLPVPALSVLDGLRSFISVLSPDGAIQFVNAEVLRRSADRTENVVGKPFATARWWTHIPGVSTQIGLALQQARAGKTSRFDVEAQFTPDQRVMIDFEMRAERDPSGAVVAIVVEGRDITEQRAMERKLRETQFHWRTIADFTVDWEFWLHPNGYFLYVSPSCQRVCGYTPDDFMQGRITLAGIAHPQDKKKVLDILTQAFSGSTDHHHSWRVVRRDGNVRWVSMSWQSVHNEDGNYMGVRGSLRDVTELMKAQEELQRSVEAYRTLARHFPKGMVALLDRDLRLVVCDGPAFEALTIDRATLIGKRLNDVLDREMLARLEPLIATVTAGSEVADIVQFGSSAWLVHLTPIRDEQDRIAHIIASAVESQDMWAASAENPTEPGDTG